jgi:DNA topoisomerase IA
MIGFKVSPLLWKRIYMSRTNALSAGRCQTPR